MRDAERRKTPRLSYFLGFGLILTAGLGLPLEALAHNVAAADRAFMESASGLSIGPYIYLGAKHMVTGYDHLLYLAGVIFFLHRMWDVAKFVSLFSLGHSITLLGGVLGGITVNPYIIDAIIGLSVAYKAFENLYGFRTVFGGHIDPRAAVFVFGLFHGFGLATKLQGLSLPSEGLVANILSFNLGVELGQLVALTFLLLAIEAVRLSARFGRLAVATNGALMTGGFILMGYQITGYFAAGG